MSRDDFGKCSNCWADLIAVWYIGTDEDGDKFKDIDYLLCPVCLKKGIVDGSFSKTIKRIKGEI